MASLHELIAAVDRETGVKLLTSKRTQALLIDTWPSRRYINELIGPLGDPDNPDVRIFLNHRTLDGTETVSLVIQDHDDDAFLNHNALGMPEKYQAGRSFHL